MWTLIVHHKDRHLQKKIDIWTHKIKQFQVDQSFGMILNTTILLKCFYIWIVFCDFFPKNEENSKFEQHFVLGPSTENKIKQDDLKSKILPNDCYMALYMKK